MVGTKTLLASRYWLDQRIMSHLAREAWQGRDLETGRAVTVWQPGTSPAADAGSLLAAAAHAARIRHPGIARILDVGLADPDGTPFVVTEQVGGTPFAAVMQAGPLEPAWTLDIVRQVTSALSAAHGSGLCLDVNPWSLRLAPGGTVKIAGFGLHQEGDRLAGGQGDNLYCLGLVAWGCLTGQLPAGGAWSAGATGQGEGQTAPHLSPLPATVPAGIAALAADLTTAGPAAPLASAAEVLARCGELLTAPMRVGRPARGTRPGVTSLLDAPVREPTAAGEQNPCACLSRTSCCASRRARRSVPRARTLLTGVEGLSRGANGRRGR